MMNDAYQSNLKKLNLVTGLGVLTVMSLMVISESNLEDSVKSETSERTQSFKTETKNLIEKHSKNLLHESIKLSQNETVTRILHSQGANPDLNTKFLTQHSQLKNERGIAYILLRSKDGSPLTSLPNIKLIESKFGMNSFDGKTDKLTPEIHIEGNSKGSLLLYSRQPVFDQSKLLGFVELGIDFSESLSSSTNSSLLESLSEWSKFISLLMLLILLAINSYIRLMLKNVEKGHRADLSSTKIKILGDISMNITREIKNPLEELVAKMDLVARQIKTSKTIPGPEVFLEQFQTMSIAIGKIAGTVRGYRTLSGGSEKNGVMNVLLKTIFEDTLSICAERIKSLDINFILSDVPNLSLVCRPSEIAQVMINLINNACDAVVDLPEKWIRIDIKRENDYLVIGVVDSGSGLSRKMAQNLMQPFYTTKVDGKSAGLGLSVSKKIVEEHGGKIYLDRNSNNTRFVVELKVKDSISNLDHKDLGENKTVKNIKKNKIAA